MINLPENYHLKYFQYHVLTWPDISFVAENDTGKIVGYVMCKLEEEEEESLPEKGVPLQFGHVISLSVLRPYRRLGLAEELMRQAEKALFQIYRVAYIRLHVRAGNAPAVNLYKSTLKFDVSSVDKSYYGDGEDALIMKKVFAS